MRRMIVAIIAATTFVMYLSADVAYASDNNGSHICLTSNSGFCDNLKGDSFSGGNPVVLYSSGHGNGLGWKLVKIGTVCDGGSCGTPSPFTSGSGLNTRYNGQPIYKIEKTQGTSGGTNGCMGSENLEGFGYAAVWSATCSGSIYDTWVYSASSYFVSVNISNLEDGPLVMTATSVEDNFGVGVETLGATQWQQWQF